MGHLHGSFLGLRRNNVRKKKTPAEIGAKFYEIYVKLSQEHPKWSQKVPKRTKMEPKWKRKGPKGTKVEPKGYQNVSKNPPTLDRAC